MLNFSFTLTTNLHREIEKAEEIRKEVLLSLISPKDELRLRWEASVNRIYYSLQMRDVRVEKETITQLLSPQGKKDLTPEENEIISYKKAYDYLYQNFFASPDHITPATVKHVNRIFVKENLGISEDDLTSTLDFIQVNPEHPIIQAGLSTILFYNIATYSDKYARIAQILPMAFLYKRGYDFRGLLVIEELLARDSLSYLELIKKSKSEGVFSGFLEYYATICTRAAEIAAQKLADRQFERLVSPSFFEISPRQQQILSSLETPGAKITNREVQKNFNVSQITASRDLARLAALGLIFAMGKGRSVQYTKS